MRGWRIGTIAGISIEIHFTWLLIFFLFLWSLATGHFPHVAPHAPRWLDWAAAVLATAMFFGSLLLHELAHSLMARRQGLRVERITLFVFGGVAELETEPRAAWSELLIAAVGPLVSGLVAGGLWVISGLVPTTSAPMRLLHESFYYVAIANAFVAVFNSVPAFPLDGGRMIRSLLWAAWRDLTRATAVAAGLGKAFGYTLGGVGVWLAIGPAHQVLDGLWLTFLGWLLAAAAEQAYARVRDAALLEQFLVGDFMTTPAVVVPATLRLEEFAHEYDYIGRAAYPVVSGGRVIGLFHREALARTPRPKWPTVLVGDVMEPLDVETMVIAADAPLAEALRRMSQARRRLMVMGRNRRLVGIITPTYVLRALRR
ncbi:MAG: site-2 protease family protein, partial [Armatimonadetes bacterium]|nr:site-2 protease family protein [Armatimonadota bacterium]